MAYTTINKSSDYFNTKLYTGNNGSNRSITGVGFQPDLVWNKNRSASANHNLWNGVTGITERLTSSGTQASENYSSEFKSFDSDGVTITQNAGSLDINNSSYNYVNWNWKANGAGSANTDGSINTTATSASTTSGFSIVKYTGGGTSATIGHGLGVAPKVIMIKCTDSTDKWIVYHNSIGNTKYLVLNDTDAETTDSAHFNNTSPTNSVFSVGTSGATSGNGQHFIAYCFAEKTGYSKFGSYVGNDVADGTFVYCGFKPAFVMLKKSSQTSDWLICDSKRNTSNVVNKKLFPNTNGTEDSYDVSDFVSNGFKIKTTSGAINASGQTYIYMAFAEAPLVGTNNVPCTAR